MSQPKTLLSIDWDFFVPEKWEWDFGHSEINPVFREHVWIGRFSGFYANGQDLQKIMTTTGKEVGFYRRLIEKLIITSTIPLFVSDSHAKSYDIAKLTNCGRVINIDAHADIGYKKDWQEDLVDCGNWLGKLLDDNYVREAIIVLSDETNEEPSEWYQGQMAMYNIEFMKLDEFLQDRTLIPIHAIHICKSGAWTPPWLDKKFETFIKTFKKRINYIDEDLGLREWNRKEVIKYAEIEKLARMEFIEQLKK